MNDKVMPAQEHFISNLIRQKIIVAIDSIDVAENDKNDRYLLFLPENEMHEIGLLFSHFYNKKRQSEVTYLGMNTPLENIAQVIEMKNITHVFTILTTCFTKKKATPYVQKLAKICSEQKLLITGPLAQYIDTTGMDNLLVFNTVQEYEELTGKKVLDDLSFKEA